MYNICGARCWHSSLLVRSPADAVRCPVDAAPYLYIDSNTRAAMHTSGLDDHSRAACPPTHTHRTRQHTPTIRQTAPIQTQHLCVTSTQHMYNTCTTRRPALLVPCRCSAVLANDTARDRYIECRPSAMGHWSLRLIGTSIITVGQLARPTHTHHISHTCFVLRKCR